MLFKKIRGNGKANGALTTIPGKLNVCTRCVHYRRENGGPKCKRDADHLYELDFTATWKYFCSHFIMDTTDFEYGLEAHRRATKKLNDLIDEEEAKQKVIPLPGSGVIIG